MATSPVTPKLTFEEYLNYDDGTDNRYELEDGELILMNPPIGLHALIIRFLSNTLEAEIKRLNLPWATLQLLGVRTAPRRSRLPDLCVIPLEIVREYLNVPAVVESGMLLAIEIVSPDSVKRDYRYKRTEYAVVGVPEYWIIDPEKQKVTVLQLVEGLYEDKEYRGDEILQSQLFSELSLTANQILQQ